MSDILSSRREDEELIEIKEGPADLDRSPFLDPAENLTFIESLLAQLLDRDSGRTILIVEFVRDDLRLGGAGGTTGTNDFTVFGNEPNISNGREILVIG